MSACCRYERMHGLVSVVFGDIGEALGPAWFCRESCASGCFVENNSRLFDVRCRVVAVERSDEESISHPGDSRRGLSVNSSRWKRSVAGLRFA